MNLRRTPAGSAHETRRGPYRPELEKLDDRIVPNVTDPTVPDTTVPDTTEPPANTSDDTITTTPTTPAPDLPPAVRVFAVGTDVGNRATVRVYDNSGSMTSEFNTYQREGYIGGVRVATADLTGDGVTDIITAPGPGMKTLIQVFDGVSGQRLIAFNAFADNFTGGAYVATGDVNGDGREDIVVGAGDVGGSHVKVFDGQKLFPAPDQPYDEPSSNTNLIREFFAYDPKYHVGARVSTADFNADGKADVITGAGNTGGPHVRIFSGEDGTIVREFFAFEANMSTGILVAGGDVNGDGTADVAVGMGPNFSGRVTVFDGRNGRQLRTFIADASNGPRSSVRVDVFDADKDGDEDLVLGVRGEMRFYDGKTYVRSGGMTPFDPGKIGGVFFG